MRNEGWRARKGKNPDNKSGLSAVGFRVLLAPEGGETVTAGGLIIPDDAALKDQNNSVWATVLEIGLDSWSDKLADWADIGDRVLVGKYAGKFEKSPIDGKRYRILNDLDILSVEVKDE